MVTDNAVIAGDLNWNFGLGWPFRSSLAGCCRRKRGKEISVPGRVNADSRSEAGHTQGGCRIDVGTRLLRIGAVAEVLEEQKPVFLPDVSQEMLKHHELAPFASESAGRSTYLFPVSTSQQRYGILAVTKLQGDEFAPEDVEMLRSLASHVAVAL